MILTCRSFFLRERRAPLLQDKPACPPSLLARHRGPIAQHLCIDCHLAARFASRLPQKRFRLERLLAKLRHYFAFQAAAAEA